MTKCIELNRILIRKIVTQEQLRYIESNKSVRSIEYISDSGLHPSHKWYQVITNDGMFHDIYVPQVTENKM